jgi:hypothetical protein
MYVYIHIYIYMYACMHVCMYVCMYVCIYIPASGRRRCPPMMLGIGSAARAETVEDTVMMLLPNRVTNIYIYDYSPSVCLSLYVCMYVCVCVYIHTYTRTC